MKRWLRSTIGLTVISVALIGAQGAAAETAPLRPQAKTLVLNPPPDAPSAGVEQRRAPEPSPARPRRPRKAIVEGHTDYSGASAVLHYLDGTTWQPYLQTYANESGYYSLRVPAGFLYAFYVSTKVSTSIYYHHIGLIPCRQTWADWSDSVKAKRGRVYSYLHTYLQPAQPGCDYP